MSDFDPDGFLRERYILVVEPDKIVTVKRDGRIKRDDDAFSVFLREVIRYHPKGRCLVVEWPDGGWDIYVRESDEWLFNHEMAMGVDIVEDED